MRTAASIASDIIDANEALRRHYGPQFPVRIAPHVTMIREAMRLTGKGASEAMLKMLDFWKERASPEEYKLVRVWLAAALVEIVRKDGEA